MTPEGHREKAERLERSLAKLRPTDWEVVIDGAMLAVSHWINWAFHTKGLTAPDDDIVHAYFVTEFERQYYGLAAGPAFLDALDEIDRMRPRCVRGNADGEASARRALDLVAVAREVALART